MPQNFPEVWVNRVEINLKTADAAPWLAGIPELDTQILEVGSGSASEQNIIHIPNTDFEVDVLINNAAYPIALQAYTDTDVTISLDKYQTKVVPLADDQVMGASYPRIDAATRIMTQAILIKKYGKAIWNLAPSGDTDNTPVLITTGRSGKFKADGSEIILTSGGFLRLVYEDLVDHKAQYDALQVPAAGRRLVLSTQHWNDLLLDRRRFGDMLVNYKTGDVAPIIAGFEIYQYVNNPYFDDTAAKVAYGVVPDDTMAQASVSFYVNNIAMKTGLTKQYYAPANLDPENQANKLAYRHYFICTPKRVKYIGAIASGTAG